MQCNLTSESSVMERAATASAISNASHTANLHKRNTSKQVSAELRSPCGTTVITLFLKNCRLLDLDLLPDWPSVTPATLGSNQDARTRIRIRCAEWCLYQLFRIYDSATTLDKLQPFFPPLEPLQSINLRAALYRCLNELKKNGVLGKEAVLRKSMLDDCQGDKFWEMCLSFSAIALRKVRVERKNKHDVPTAERIGTAEGLNRSQRDSMLPLAIAHRAALTKLLSHKDQKKQAYARLYHVLIDKEADLRVRKMQARDQDQAGKKRSRPSSAAQHVLETKWVGNTEVRDALLDGHGHGHNAAGTDNLLAKPFDQVWQANGENRLFKREASDTGILEDLEARTRHQKRRLVKWQTFHEKLLATKPEATKDEITTKGPQFCFDRHQNLTLRDISDNFRPPSSPSKHAPSESVAKYDEILTAMREELRKRSATDPVSPTKPIEARRPVDKRPNKSVDAVIRTSPEPHQRSMSQTAVPLRPMFGKRVSSRSRSYAQPKVINQREPIPLKSEIFSPLKTDRRSSATPSPRGSILASPMEDPLLESGLDSVVQRLRQNSAGTDTGLDNSAPSRSTSSTSSPRMSWKSQLSENADNAVEVPFGSSAATRNLDSVGRTMRPSLADRTRMSMAFKSCEDTLSLRSEVQTINEDYIHDKLEPVEAALRQRPTLQERTRQSISLAPGPSSAPRKAPFHARSRTSQYPINQFETPAKTLPRRSTMTLAVDVNAGAEADEDPAIKRNITPREKLFDQDAEYSSIFKARPKVARSPDLTPQDDSGLGDLEMGEAEAEEEDVVGVGSPLVGR